MNTSVISFDTYQPRQDHIMTHTKPKAMPHRAFLGIRETDDPGNYMKENRGLVEQHTEEIVTILNGHNTTIIILNLYFALVPELWQIIQEHQSKISRILIITCRDKECREHISGYDDNLPIQIIPYSDDSFHWTEGVAKVLK